MPCYHKFKDELDLSLLDYEPATLIVGTFTPGLLGEDTAPWFYGRSESHFWNVLPRLYGEVPLAKGTPAEWRKFCRDRQIAIIDIISVIDDAELGNREHLKALASFSDSAFLHNFEDFGFVNIPQILKHRPSIRNIYFTRGITEAFWRHAWNPVIQYSSKNGVHERRLLTPSDDALYQYEVYNEEHPADQLPTLEDYILMRWRQEWHF